MKGSHRIRASRVVVPKSPTIMEVTEDSSPNDGPNNNGVPANKFGDHPRIQEKGTEYTSLIPHNTKKGYGSAQYTTYPDSSGDNDSCCSASDELSSNASVTSKMNRRQFLIFSMIMLSSLSSSFAVCLFPPFFPPFHTLPP